MSHQVFLQQVLLSKPFVSSIIPTQLWNSSGDLGCLLILASFFAMVFVEVKRGLFYRIFSDAWNSNLEDQKVTDWNQIESLGISCSHMFAGNIFSKKSRTWIHWCSSRNTPQGFLKVRSPIPQIPCNQINQVVHRSGTREVYGLLGSVLWNFSLGRSSWKSLRLLFCSWFVFAVCVCVCLQFIWANSECVQINCKCARTANSHSWPKYKVIIYISLLDEILPSVNRYTLKTLVWISKVLKDEPWLIGFCRPTRHPRNVLEMMTWRFFAARS